MRRRDSFISHRAFCDALAEENMNKVNQGLLNNIGSNFQTQMPELMSSMPMTTTTIKTSIGTSEFDNLDFENPLKLHQEPVTVAFKPVNMTGGMFSITSSGTFFGGPRTSSSSSLQLSSNSSSGFNYHQDSKKGSQISGFHAHMSATALLQKAAQMGATASNSITSPMMQKSFVSSMAGPDQLSPIRTPYTIQQHNTSYDHFQPQPDQSTMVGMNGEGFTNQPVQKGPQGISQTFDTTGGSAIHDMEFSQMFMGIDQNQGFIKNMEQKDSHSSSLFHGRTTVIPERNPTGTLRFGGSDGGNDMATLDLLGIGGTRPQQHQPQLQPQQQRLGMEAKIEPTKVANYEAFPPPTHTWGGFRD